MIELGSRPHLATFGLLALASLEAPCYEDGETIVHNGSDSDVGAGISEVNRYSILPPPAPSREEGASYKSPPPDGWDVVVAVRNETVASGHGFQSLPFDLWAPFRWEVTAGRLDAATPGPGTGFFCTELDVRGSSPLEFYALCAQPSGDGYTAWVSRRGENFVGTLDIPSSVALDLAVEHDGTTMTFRARAAGVGEFQTVASLEQAPTAPFMPSLGAAQLPLGAGVDFDDFRIASNGPLPVAASAEAVLARGLADAGGPLVDAAHSLRGPTAPPGVAVEFALAAAALREAEEDLLEEAAGLSDPGAAKRSAKLVRASWKAASKAGAVLQKGKPPRSAMKSAFKAVLALTRAVQAIDPHTFPQ